MRLCRTPLSRTGGRRTGGLCASAALAMAPMTLWLGAAHGAQSGVALDIHSLPLGAGERVSAALAADMDRDGARDLLLAIERESGRELRIHRARPQGARRYAGQPDARLELSVDTIAFAPLALGAAGPRAVALFGPRGAVSWAPEAPEAERLRRLVSADLLWQLPADAGPFPFPAAVADLNGDGLEDLLLPTRRGYALAWQRADGDTPFGEPVLLRLPDTRALAAERGLDAPEEGPAALGDGGVSLRLGAGRPDRAGLLVRVSDQVPSPFAADLIAPGRRDLIALDDLFLHTWSLGPNMAGGAPDQSLVSPVRLDARRQLDVSFSAHVAHLDRDGRTDLIFVAGDQRAREVRSQVLVFNQSGRAAGARDPFGERGTPDQVLVLAGFVADAELVDVDGDGLPDLVLTTLRPDLFDTLRQAVADRLELELVVYRNEGGRFARRPSFSQRVRVALEGSEPLVRFARRPGASGFAYLLLREEPGRLVAQGLRAGRDGSWSLLPRPLQEVGLHADARLVTVPGPGPGAPIAGVLALEPGQVLALEVR